MVNKASESADINSFSNLALAVEQVVCTFRFDDREYYIVQYAPDRPIETVFLAGSVFSEVSRFQIDGRCCAVLSKSSEKSTGRSDISRLLTARELQIATLVAMGCPNKQVAGKLHISEWTVATYLRRIFAKLNVDTRAAMTYRCASLINHKVFDPNLGGDVKRPPR